MCLALPKPYVQLLFFMAKPNGGGNEPPEQLQPVPPGMTCTAIAIPLYGELPWDYVVKVRKATLEVMGMAFEQQEVSWGQNQTEQGHVLIDFLKRLEEFAPAGKLEPIKKPPLTGGGRKSD